METKVCTKCGIEVPASEIVKGRTICKDCRRAYQRAYQEANREKLRAYREANRERDRARWRAYNEANREKRLAYKRAWHERKRIAEFMAQGMTEQEATVQMLISRATSKNGGNPAATETWRQAKVAGLY